MQPIRAVIFDVDGTLLDTREYIFRAFEHALTTHNYQPDRRVISPYVGANLLETYRALAPENDPEILANHHREFQSTHIELVKPYDGLVDLITSLKAAGFQVGAWSSRFKNLEQTLDFIGITPHLDVVIDGSHVTKHKPDPEGLYLALGALKQVPENTVMVGDSIFDIHAGKAANVALTIGITHGFGSYESLVEARPDHLVDRLSDIPPLVLR